MGPVKWLLSTVLVILMANSSSAQTRRPVQEECPQGRDIRATKRYPATMSDCEVLDAETAKDNKARPLAPTANPTRSYTMKVGATRGNFPSVIGETDLPDGTVLVVSILKPRLPDAAARIARGIPECVDDCLPATGQNGGAFGEKVTVLYKSFAAGPFSWHGKPLDDGPVEVEVYLFSIPDEIADTRASFETTMERMKKPIYQQTVVVQSKK